MGVIAIYPGTFDPVTKGHLDIIDRSSKIVDTLIIAVAKDTGKKTLFDQEERANLIEHEIKKYKNVKVVRFSGLLCNFFRDQKANFVVRGLRTFSDFENEFLMAVTNKKLYNGMETLFLPATEDVQFTSSSLVKQISMLGGNVSFFITENVERAIREKLEATKI
jgi:pantetheine-phosphate adenylyltransferase